jgi:hypothetical protein
LDADKDNPERHGGALGKGDKDPEDPLGLGFGCVLIVHLVPRFGLQGGRSTLKRDAANYLLHCM